VHPPTLSVLEQAAFAVKVPFASAQEPEGILKLASGKLVYSKQVFIVVWDASISHFVVVSRLCELPPEEFSFPHPTISNNTNKPLSNDFSISQIPFQNFPQKIITISLANSKLAE
jgi:hypothetical protein